MGGVIKPWPYESALSIGDRIVTQRALAQLGFDPGPPDGVVGVNTRNALRSWQKSRGITADGYLSLDMVARLKTEANIL
jgi:peptidoglycan hydrolase-like protein with peptidoglycan-binding domain